MCTKDLSFLYHKSMQVDVCCQRCIATNLKMFRCKRNQQIWSQCQASRCLWFLKNNERKMPCSSCRCYIKEPSWHPCDRRCVQWSDADGTWVAVLRSNFIVRCCKSHIDNSFWFFYCPECKRDPAISCLRGSKIVQKRERVLRCITDYISDSSNDTEREALDSMSESPEDVTPSL